MFAPVTRHASTVASAGELYEHVLQAGERALSAPSGPVYVGLPTDLLTAGSEAPTVRDARPARPLAAAEADVLRATELLDGARRPLIWAGGGAVRANAGPALGELASRLAAPVITTYMARGLLGADHPCLVPGPPHMPAIGALWDEADVVLAVGSDLDGMMTQNWLMPQPPTLIAINVDGADASKNYRVDVTLAADAREATAALWTHVRPREGLDELRVRLAGLDAQLLKALDSLPADSPLVLDMCIPGYWLGGFGTPQRPRRQLYPVGWGTLGFAFPASLGAALAGAGRTVCLCGDGGFLFACGELATAAQERLALTIVLVDDGGYGMLRFDQTHAGDANVAVDLHTPDFVALANAFGIGASRVQGFGTEFVDELTASLAAPGPFMIVVDAALRPPPTTSPRWYRRRG
jgi:acetolactate synthase-1/2/3 large subunit